jgi:hypothetical protein
MIWSSREEGEEDEETILRRVLREKRDALAASPVAEANEKDMRELEGTYGVSRHSTWWQIIEAALRRIGGQGTLSEIYNSLRHLSKEIGKNMPPSLEAVVRGTLEDNSSDSGRWKQVRDVFEMPRGKHSGFWALRRKR